MTCYNGRQGINNLNEAAAKTGIIVRISEITETYLLFANEKINLIHGINIDTVMTRNVSYKKFVPLTTLPKPAAYKKNQTVIPVTGYT